MGLKILIDKIKAQPETLEFADVMAAIDARYTYSETKILFFPFNTISRFFR